MFLDTPSLYALRSIQVSSVHYSMMSSERFALAPGGCPARLARSPFAHLPAVPPFALRLASVATLGGSCALDPLRASRLPSLAFRRPPGFGLDRPSLNAVRFLSSRPRVLFSPGGGRGRGVSCAPLFPRHAPGARRQASALCARRSALGTQKRSISRSFYYCYDSLNRCIPQGPVPPLLRKRALVVPSLYPRSALQAALYPLSETVKSGPYGFWLYDCTSHLQHVLERSRMQFWTFEHAVDRPTGSILLKMIVHACRGTIAIAVLLEPFSPSWSVWAAPGRAAALPAIPYQYGAMIPYSLQKKVSDLYCVLSLPIVVPVPSLLIVEVSQ